MNKNNFCVIMAGGVGARFWPLSRNSKPKQFIDFLGTGRSLIQLTYDRFIKIIPKENIYIVTNQLYYELVKKQIPDLQDYQIVLEPSRRNTAPCIAYATYKIHKLNKNAKIVVAPSDHLILKEEEFLNVITNAFEAIEDKDILMTLGIKPSRPETGYGYIQNVDIEDNESITFKNPDIKKVKLFTEKPDIELAKAFLESGDFLWNSGLFVWSADSIIKALKKHLGDVCLLFDNIYDKLNTDQEIKIIQDAYNECRNISIDYGVMEKAQNVYVYEADFGWSDLGTWGSLHEQKDKDENNNALNTKNILVYETTNSIIHMPKDKLAVVHGLDDYIVVESNNILLICKKSDEQKLRQFVNDVYVEKGENFI